LEKKANAMAESIGDATISYVLERFPIAVLHGHLTCDWCPRPSGATSSPSGPVSPI